MGLYTSYPATTANIIANRAINYGDGVFETILINNYKLPLWDLHYARLTHGLQKLQIKPPCQQLLLEKLTALIDSSDLYVAKILLFRDDLTRGYASNSNRCCFHISIHPYKTVSTHNSLSVSSVRLAKQKQLAGIKHLNRLEQVLAAQELIGTEYQDAIMLDSKNNVIESINKNIVFIKDKHLYTPKLHNCGVYGVALRWLETQDYQLKWKKIEFKSIQKYHAMMTCNSIHGFVAIKNIKHKIQFEETSPLVAEIQHNWQSHIQL